VLVFSAKLYPRVLGITATSNLRVIFIILIITLNLHDPSLSGYGCNTIVFNGESLKGLGKGTVHSHAFGTKKYFTSTRYKSWIGLVN